MVKSVREQIQFFLIHLANLKFSNQKKETDVLGWKRIYDQTSSLRRGKVVCLILGGTSLRNRTQNKTYYVDSTLVGFLHFVPVKNETHTWKYSKNIHILPVKTKIHTWKNLPKCPWKIFTTRENLQKSVRESDFLSMKKLKN